MNCPVCNVTLSMSQREGIEIDFCPQCRGVWLDRGELDKIIERSRKESMAPPPFRDDRSRDDRYSDDRGDYRKKRRESFWEELFD